MILSDTEIKERAIEHDMITPFFDKSISSLHGSGILSYGISSYGYDPRVAGEFQIFTNTNDKIVDPKNFDKAHCICHVGDSCVIPPNGFVLTCTMERFKIPRDILVICLGKSTYARCGVVVNATPLEPEWEGYVTLEFSNTSPNPVKIYASEGACQFIFLKANKSCATSYADRNGKYQGQSGITLPIV